jgi:hypothetical protein
MVWQFVAAAASIYGAYQSSKAAGESAAARKRQAERNAEYLRSQARFAEQVAGARQISYERQATRFKSRQKGMFAKAGVDLSGSVLNVLGETSASLERQLYQIDWASKNEIKFANAKARNSILTANDAMAALPYQQAAYWAQGIGGVATAFGDTGFPNLGFNISTPGFVSNYFDSLSTGS